MHINAQLLCTTHNILEPRPLLSYKNAFKMAESVATIDMYLSGLLAVILVDWKHAWQIEADEYESDC